MLESFWRAFLTATGRDQALRWDFCDHFGSSEAMCGMLTEAILSGRKRATCAALAAFRVQGERCPQEGDLTLVTDWFGSPVCVIRTTGVQTLPFSQISEEMALREGEDADDAAWRAGHERFFREDGAALGYAFSPDMPVVYEEIQRIWPQPSESRDSASRQN